MPSELIVLGQFKKLTPVEDGPDFECDGWIFTCQAELVNLMTMLETTGGKNLYVSLDGTHKLLYNGWILINFISETIIDSEGGEYVVD
jgi:hypothetical protein